MIASHQSGTVLTAVKTASRPPSAVACATLRPVLTAAARGALANSRSGRGNGASIEQRNWLLGPGSTDRLSSIGKRDSHDWRESENHAQTAHRRAADDPSPTPDATPGPAPGGAPAATSAAGAAPPATTATLGGGGSDTDPPCRTNTALGSITCRPVSEARHWRRSCRPSLSSTSRSCKRSTRRAATAVTDTGGSPPRHPTP